MAKLFRSWGFLASQVVFVAGWFGAHHFFPNQTPFEVLQVLLLTEGCCIGSIFLMHQHREHALDRRIALNDYIVDCQIKHDIKVLIKDMEKKNNFWCNGCGESRYKCCCEEHKVAQS